MRLPTWYKLTSLSLYLSQLKHTLMSAMMSNKSCQRIKLNILLKTRVIWKFVFFWVSLWRPVSGHNQGTKALCGVRGGQGSFSGHHGLSLPSQGRHMQWRCTDGLMSYCLSKLVVWKLRTFRMQPTRNITRLQSPAASAVLVECCTAHYPGEWRWVAIDVITGTFYLIITLHPSSRGKRYTKAILVSSKF